MGTIGVVASAAAPVSVSAAGADTPRVSCSVVSYKAGSATVDVPLAISKSVDTAARNGAANWLLRIRLTYVSANGTVETVDSGLKSVANDTTYLGSIDDNTDAIGTSLNFGSLPPPGNNPSFDCTAELELQVSSSPYLDTTPVVRDDRITWTSFDASGHSDVFLYDIASATTTQVTHTGTADYPSMDGTTLVYADQVGAPQHYNIFAYDIATGTTTQLTNDAFDQLRPAVSGANVIWEDYRNGATDPRIYGLTLPGGAEFEVDANPAAQHDPAISGNVVVWQDERNVTPNVYAMDLTNLGTEIPVAAGAVDAESPAIDSGRIVFSEKVDGVDQIDVYDQGTTTTVQPSGSNETHPKISGNLLVWEDARNAAASGVDLFGVDLYTPNALLEVDTEPLDQTHVDINGSDVVFTDNRNGNEDVFLLVIPFAAVDSTAPTVTVETPAEGAVYALNEVVRAGYFCSDEAGGSGVASCSGTAENGAAIDTASIGSKTFTVTATDNAGNTSSLTHHYSVTVPTVTSVSPSSGEIGATVTISGSDFMGGCSNPSRRRDAPAVFFGALKIDPVLVSATNTTITVAAPIPDAGGTVDLTVEDCVDNVSATSSADRFTYLPTTGVICSDQISYVKGSRTVDIPLAISRSIDTAARSGSNWLLHVTLTYVSENNDVQILDPGFQSLADATSLVRHIDSGTDLINITLGFGSLPLPYTSPYLPPGRSVILYGVLCTAELQAPADSTAPTITLTTPPESATYTLNQVVNADYACQDEAGGSGLASCVGTVANGAAIDTASVGAKTFTVTATDNVGNTSSVTHHYSVGYRILGFFSPVPNSKWKKGQTVPIKVALADTNVTRISDAEAQSLAAACRVTFKVTGSQSVGPACVKYDSTLHQFVYSWKIAGSGTGPATISVTVTYPGTTATTLLSESITVMS